MQRTFLLPMLLVFLFAGCANKEEKIDKSSEQVTYESAQRHLRTSSWEAAAQTLEVLEETFPFGVYAEQGQLELIYAYFKSNDFELSIAAADRFIRLHPQHRNVDYAYYMRGIASFYNDTGFFSILATDTSKRDPGTARESFNYFAQLIERYPDSAYALDAQKRMIYLRNALARYEIHVANYYFKRGAYLAAANRGKYIVENFQTTPAVPDGLAVMAQAYELLGMKELSRNAVRVLALNFPNYPALNKNGEFDFQFTEQSRSWVSYLTLGLFDKHPGIKFDTRKKYNHMYKNVVEPTPPA